MVSGVFLRARHSVYIEKCNNVGRDSHRETFIMGIGTRTPPPPFPVRETKFRRCAIHKNAESDESTSY